jgi:hypothetical protein
MLATQRFYAPIIARLHKYYFPTTAAIATGNIRIFLYTSENTFVIYPNTSIAGFNRCTLKFFYIFLIFFIQYDIDFQNIIPKGEGHFSYVQEGGTCVMFRAGRVFRRDAKQQG